MAEGICGVVLGLALSVAGAAAYAETESEVLYSYKSWQVSVVGFDDGSFACLAEVSDPGESFSIWTYADGSAKLQFYSSSWDFGEAGDTANLEVEVDNRSPWTLSNADLYQNSVLFNLPASDAGANFMIEVAKGNTLHLRAEDGSGVMDYSLAGSRASISAMFDCSDALAGTSTNPFK